VLLLSLPVPPPSPLPPSSPQQQPSPQQPQPEHAAAMTAAILAALPMSLPLSPQPVSAVALAARRSSPTPPFHPLLLPPDARKPSVLWPSCACVGLSAAWWTVPERLAGM